MSFLGLLIDMCDMRVAVLHRRSFLSSFVWLPRKLKMQQSELIDVGVEDVSSDSGLSVRESEFHVLGAEFRFHFLPIGRFLLLLDLRIN